MILNLHLKPSGEPLLVAAIKNPENMAENSLKKCIENAAGKLIYLKSEKGKEIQLTLNFKPKP